LALLYWHTWRERLDRPEQSRIYRKAWAYSDLLFPNSKGEALTKYAMRNAVSRLSVRGEARIRLTPGMVRQAFLQLEE
jgi:site-specific recombinase XerD